ncbi:MAG TPA: RNase P subunit p30 family protein [Geobacterales bacterium]|nr:RNase P subunit p30 family protein [Geobacterales bacterium]
MKKYIDLYIRINSIDSFKNVLYKIKEFGYKYIGFEEDQILDKKIEICNLYRLDYIIRSKKYVPKYKEKTVYATIFENKKESMEEIKRYKINIITVYLSKINELDEEFINFISQRRTKIEILYSDFLYLNYGELKDLIPKISRIMKYAIKKGLSPIVSSGIKEEKEIRSPKEVAAFLRCIGIEDAELLLDVKNLKELFVYEVL